MGGNLKADKIEASGDIECGGKITGGDIVISGDITVKDGIEGEKITISGDINSNGLINGDEIYITMSGNHDIKEIGGRFVAVTESISRNGIIGSLFSNSFRNKGSLQCECIEGDDILLKNSKVDIVRGKNVTIGKGSIINKVEYSGELIIEDNGIVKESVRI